MNYPEAIDQLEKDILQLKIDFERYFNGDLPLPPEPLRQELQVRLRKFRSVSMRSTVDRFRLVGLTARFNSLSELINRRLRSQEQAKLTARRGADGRQGLDARTGVTLGATLDPEVVSCLYDALYSEENSPKTGVAGFREYLTKQMERIQKRTGCDEVRFRVEHDGDRLTLRAKPIETTELEAD